MRKVTFGGANSLDNFLARADGGMDWLLWDDEVSAVIADFWTKIDTVVMGRKTYEHAVKSGGGGGGENPYPGVRSYICSRTMAAIPADNVEVVADGVALLRQLKAQPGKDICVMGGGELGASLLNADLIDEVGVNIHPVLLGTGVPLFPGLTRQVDLELIDSKVFKTGCVALTYRVKR
jgi:dihydrofolate reductase